MRVRILARTVAVAVAVALPVALGPATACAASTRVTDAPRLAPSTKVTITGHGYGHGHGMSQWGAQGAALKGKTYPQILSFYYPHTGSGRVGGTIRALITRDTSADVVVQNRSGLVARAVATGRTWKLPSLRPKASRFKITPVSGGRSALAYKVKSGWHRMSVVKGDLAFNAGGRPIRLYLPSGSAEYRGTLRSASPKPGKWGRRTVNIVSLEAYLKGVVPNEAYPSWRPAALRAQAVAARSYAAHGRNHPRARYFDVYDDTRDQAYGGYDFETSTTSAAVDATRGRVRTYGGKPAYTQFSASNGGYLLKGDKPYLVSKKDPYDVKASGDPNLTWKRTVTVRQIMNRWPSAGGIVSIRVSKRVAGTGGRYVDTVTIEGTKRTYTATGSAVESWAGLKSTWFSFTTG
ncbi:SpoIID/LytB domain-containing protein [Nocardioides cheoyonin]|uniref:SpoIID/LytB domain-containing protein n=1 Tax=Nocardioides cheoyonin TaxID=3156615 RepID=UPI0032B52949